MAHSSPVLLYHRKNSHAVYLSLCCNYFLICLTKLSSLQQGLSLIYHYDVWHGIWHKPIPSKCLLSEVTEDIIKSAYRILEKQ